MSKNEHNLSVGRSAREILVVPSVTERAERLLTTEDLKFGSPTAENIKSAQSMGFTEFQPDYCLCSDFFPPLGRVTNALSASHVA